MWRFVTLNLDSLDTGLATQAFGICCLAVISHPAKFNRSSVEQLEHTKTLSFVVTSGGVKHAYTTSNTQTVYPSKFNRFGWDSVHIVLQIPDFRVSLMAEIELDS